MPKSPRTFTLVNLCPKLAEVGEHVPHTLYTGEKRRKFVFSRHGVYEVLKSRKSRYTWRRLVATRVPMQRPQAHLYAGGTIELHDGDDWQAYSIGIDGCLWVISGTGNCIRSERRVEMTDALLAKLAEGVFRS